MRTSAATAPEPPVAEYLDIILYSREQIRKETAAMGKEEDGETAPWGIISVKAQDVDYELPMQPSRAPHELIAPPRVLSCSHAHVVDSRGRSYDDAQRAWCRRGRKRGCA